MALLSRTKGQKGQVVDVALYESIFNLMEAVVPEFSGAGVIREPSGTTVTGIVPTNTYRCKDGRYVVIGGNGDSIYKRLMNAAGRTDLADDIRLQHNPGRVEHQALIDQALTEWTESLPSKEVVNILEEARVPAGPIYNVKDMMEDPHFQAREVFEQVEINGEPLTIPAITPKLSGTPGSTRWPGPELGADNRRVYEELLEIPTEELDKLAADNII